MNAAPPIENSSPVDSSDGTTPEDRAPFGAAYSAVYDLIYRDKDYALECDLIERCLQCATPPQELGQPTRPQRSDSDMQVRSILDLGCGTGRHALILAERGYSVIGVDRSAGMIRAARLRARAATAPLPPEFREADLRQLRMDRTFDGVLMMFAVLSYQAEEDDLRRALDVVRMHLRPGGVFVFDCWYGPAVEHLEPETRTTRREHTGGVVERKSASTLEKSRRRVTVNFDVERAVDGARSTARETHVLRYFFARELEVALGCSGLSLLSLRAMPDFEKPPDETTWNVLGVARRVGPAATARS